MRQSMLRMIGIGTIVVIGTHFESNYFGTVTCTSSILGSGGVAFLYFSALTRLPNTMCTSINDTKAVLRGKQLCGLHLVALSPYRCPLSKITQALS